MCGSVVFRVSTTEYHSASLLPPAHGLGRFRSTSRPACIRRLPNAQRPTSHIVLSIRRSCALLLVIVVAGCVTEKTGSNASSDSSKSTSASAPFTDSTATSPAVAAAAQAIDTASLLQHIKDLSADSMEGRAPGTPGEEKAVAYMTQQFKALGLKPGNPDGTYIQNVDLIGYKAHPTASFTARRQDDVAQVSRRLHRQLAARRDRDEVDNSDVVFVGYGVVAPEYGWDDYKGVDVKGKTILMLVNDPAGPRRPRTTRRARHDDVQGPGDDVLRPLDVQVRDRVARRARPRRSSSTRRARPAIRTRSSGQQLAGAVRRAIGRTPRIASPVEGWMTLEKAKELFRDAGQNFDSLKAAATRKDFKPVALDAKATFTSRSTRRQIQSKNVVAKLEGTRQEGRVRHLHARTGITSARTRRSRAIRSTTARWTTRSGSAALLEIAKAFTKLPTPPQRSILFLSVTAEEKGLVGAKYYAHAPALSARQDASRTSTWTGSTSGAGRATSP